MPTTTRTRRLKALAAVCALGLVAVACGDDDDTTTDASATTVAEGEAAGGPRREHAGGSAAQVRERVQGPPRVGRAERAAMLAALLVERGLGGDAADLAERLERFERERGGRAGDMRRLAANWAAMAGSGSAEPADSGWSLGGLSTVSERVIEKPRGWCRALPPGDWSGRGGVSLASPVLPSDGAPARTVRVELAAGDRKVSASIDARDESRLLSLLETARARVA